MKRSFTLLSLSLLVSLAWAGCETAPSEPTLSLFEMPGDVTQDLFALPYPNDLRVRADGTIDLAKLSADQPGLIQIYLDRVAANHIGGFGTNAAAYFRFSAPLELRSLPATPQDSLQPGASVFWVNLQQGKGHYGERVPLTFKFQAAAGRYAGANLLAVLPVPGFVLEPESRYAVVITDGLVDTHEVSVQPHPDLRALLDSAKPEPRLERGHSIYTALRIYLAEQQLTGVVSATVFTTGKPTGLVQAARKVVHRQAEPKGSELVVARAVTNYVEVRGTYQAPNFQTGDPPYMQQSQGGTIARNVVGEPLVARTEEMRFALSVPLGPMPAKGWPIVLYAHGTGGSYRTFLTNGVAALLGEIKDAQGKVIEQMAVIGIDQVLHGTRAPEGTNVELAFFNFNNPGASVDNVLQGGIDNFQLLRLVKNLTFDKVPWMEGVNKAGEIYDFGATKFDPDRIYFMGHSQGGLTGPSFLAAEPEIKGAVLSGAGGGAALSLLYKTAPIDIGYLLEAALKEKLDQFHPVLNLFQQMLEPADPNNYAPRFYHAPLPGLAPKPIFLSEGLIDHYTPTATTEALAVAMRAPPLGKVLQEVAGLALRGLTASNLPVSGNVSSADGQTVTAGLMQYETQKVAKSCTTDKDCSGYCDAGTCRREGHFVMFDNPEAERQYSVFLGTLARDGRATIVP